jgi:hypothetical protein
MRVDRLEETDELNQNVLDLLRSICQQRMCRCVFAERENDENACSKTLRLFLQLLIDARVPFEQNFWTIRFVVFCLSQQENLA